MQYAPTTLHAGNRNGDQFLSQIIAINEFWPWAYKPELKHQFMEWRHVESPRSQKFHQIPSQVKLMVIILYDSVIVCHFVLHGRTVTAQYYKDFLVQQVSCGIRDKCPDLVDYAIILHDNARPHKAECVWQLLRRSGWEELEYPLCSPSISPCGFDLIPKIKEPLHGRWFATREDIANAVCQQVTRFTLSAANAEADGIQFLPHR